MIVLGLIGRPDVSLCHDAAACLIVDGKVIGALEQERVSRRRYAPGEGPEGAVRTLLAAHGLHPSDIQAIGYAWQDVSPGVAWFNGPNEFGPRALGARSLLASPTHRTTLDRLNRVKGREPWRPAALSLTAAGFHALDMEPPVRGLSDYMLCTHRVSESRSHRAAAGVHVDGTSRAQYVPDDADCFGALLAAVGDESGLPGVINTSLNTRGQPMVLTPGQALELMVGTSEIDMLAMPPYLVRRS